MASYEELQKTQPILAPYAKEGLKWATKYYKRMDDTRAYVIGMRKLSVLPSVSTQIYRTI
jgi:hypothetical protein